MKRITLLLALLPALTFAQEEQPTEFPLDDGKIVYKEVKEVPATSLEELMERAAHYFKQTESAKKGEDKDGGVFGTAHNDFIAGKKDTKVKMSYNLAIEVKDGRYRIVCSNIDFQAYPDQYNPQPRATSANTLHREYQENASKTSKQKRASYQKEYLNNMDRLIKERVKEIESVMIKSVPQVQDDW